MKTKRTFIAAAGAAALALGGLLVAAPAASANEAGIHELPQDRDLPSFPGFAPSFDTVTVVDAETGAVVGTRPNLQGRGVTIIGPGCTTTSLCLYSNPYRGYQGTGSMAVSVGGVSTYTNGNRIGQLQWKSGSATITGPKTPGPVAISGGPVTIVKVTLF
ncbi:hypothetical protein ACFRFH_04160 [Leifsonia sp. NPDC056824]|uniref:hypothetical protein n=1 Tax=Leifsonia sp. NPDC056824 TaxID=3345953 RepID=UPI0036BD0D70